MKLIPKAKPVRIRIFSGGEEHAPLESLRAHFDLDDLLPLFRNGSLHRWLNQIGENDIKERLDGLIIKDPAHPTAEESIKFTKILYAESDDLEMIRKIVRGYEAQNDWPKIRQWHIWALQLGNIESAFVLAQMYDLGRFGCPVSCSDAIHYYAIAAKGGYVKAQYRLGEIYYEGLGIEQSTSRAITWLEQADKQNYLPAAYKLGTIYFYSAKERKNAKEYGALLSKSIAYLTKAANANYTEAYGLLGLIYWGLEQYDKVKKWILLALEYCKEEQEKPNLYRMLGESCFRLDHSDSEAYAYVEKAADAGNPDAQYLLSLFYSKGYCGVEQSDSKAFDWCKAAAENNEPAAQCTLGHLYRQGAGDVPKSLRMAIVWYQKSIAQGIIKAKVGLAHCYEELYKYQEAFDLMKEAAGEDIPEAQYCMGQIYETGKLNVRKNRPKAIEWYKKAADNGYDDADVKLLELGYFDH